MRLCVAYTTQECIPLSRKKDILDKLNRYKTTRMMKDLKNTCEVFCFFLEKKSKLNKRKESGEGYRFSRATYKAEWRPVVGLYIVCPNRIFPPKLRIICKIPSLLLQMYKKQLRGYVKQVGVNCFCGKEVCWEGSEVSKKIFSL